MKALKYIERTTGLVKEEIIYGKFFVELVYGDRLKNIICRFFFLPFIARLPYFSQIFGRAQKRPASKKKIDPFIKKYNIKQEEFLNPSSSFNSFNDFFIRKLKKGARPVHTCQDSVVFPADGRHLVYPDLSCVDKFYAKGQLFDLKAFLNDSGLCALFSKGSMVISRLCPVDYHRYHFPFDCNVRWERPISGSLSSVNPFALKKYLNIFWNNKRVISLLESKYFGEALYVEIGATCVGSINNTYKNSAIKDFQKGDEKGYFEFGGSCVIIIFKPNTIIFDADLVSASARCIETYAQMGTKMGKRENKHK